MPQTAIEAALELLAEYGVRHIFGNPGTTELPLTDALAADERFSYVLGLQEVPVLAMADGFAMARGDVALVNLHTCPGLGNALGMLYNAYREGTPLVVTAGQQDRRLAFEEPILWGDMVSVARPWTKWSVEVQRGADLPLAFRRAVSLARTPPTGPVFLSLPIDVQQEIGEFDLSPIRVPDGRVRPAPGVVAEAARVLLGSRRPAILAGSRVQERDAVNELVAVAERLGAPVFAESGTTHGRLPFPADHPLAGPGLPLWSPDVRERLADYDALLVVGMDLLRQYVYHEPVRPIPEGIRLVQVDEDAWQIGKNYAVDAGVVGDVKGALAELTERLDALSSDEFREAARQRHYVWGVQRSEYQERLRARIETGRAERPLRPEVLMEAIGRVLPKNATVIEEAVTTTQTTLERLGALKNTSGYFGHRGWGLGWGLNCAIGVQLAWPDRPALGIIGEGAAMYGIQGLWTAARYQIPVTWVIPNNAQYQILKVGAQGLNLPQATAGKFVGMDLTEPEVDILGLARAFGVEAVQAESPEEVSEAVAAGLNSNRPTLINVPIARRIPGELGYS